MKDMLSRYALWKHICYMNAYYAFSRDDQRAGDVYSADVTCRVCRMCLVLRSTVIGYWTKLLKFFLFMMTYRRGGLALGVLPGFPLLPLPLPPPLPPCGIFVLSRCPLRLSLLPPVLLCVWRGAKLSWNKQNWLTWQRPSHCVKVKTIKRNLRRENVKRNDNFTIKNYNFNKWFQKIVPFPIFVDYFRRRK